jgi:hypothetical protein
MTDQQTPGRVSSDPVPVPPPADDADRERDEARRDSAEDVTDRVPADALDDRGEFEDPVLSGERNDPDDLTAVTPGSGAPDYHEPPPQQTAFGAATVGGAAAAAAQAGPYSDVRDRADAEPEGAVGDRSDTDRGTDVEPARNADLNGRDVRDDLGADGTATGRATVDADRADLDVDQRDLDADQRDLDADLAGLPEAAPAVDMPAAVEEPIVGLWGEETAQGYRDRWREVQLRFVDDPPAAAREANLLVEEAVGALTAELSRQKETLGRWSGEETEELRSVVRRHRDFLDRLLGL